MFLLICPELLTDMLTDVPWTPPPYTEFTWDIRNDLRDLRKEAFTNTSIFMEYV
jgi:hypothetical protein